MRRWTRRRWQSRPRMRCAPMRPKTARRSTTRRSSVRRTIRSVRCCSSAPIACADIWRPLSIRSASAIATFPPTWPPNITALPAPISTDRSISAACSAGSARRSPRSSRSCGQIIAAIPALNTCTSPMSRSVASCRNAWKAPTSPAAASSSPPKASAQSSTR